MIHSYLYFPLLFLNDPMSTSSTCSPSLGPEMTKVPDHPTPPSFPVSQIQGPPPQVQHGGPSPPSMNVHYDRIVTSCRPSVMCFGGYCCTNFVSPPNATNSNFAASTAAVVRTLVVPNVPAHVLVVSALATRLMMARGGQREFHVPRPSCVPTSLLSLLERERSRGTVQYHACLPVRSSRITSKAVQFSEQYLTETYMQCCIRSKRQVQDTHKYYKLSVFHNNAQEHLTRTS